MASRCGYTNVPKALEGGNQNSRYEVKAALVHAKQSATKEMNSRRSNCEKHDEDEQWARQFVWPDEEETAEQQYMSRCAWCHEKIVDSYPRKFCSESCASKPKFQEVYSRFEVNFLFDFNIHSARQWVIVRLSIVLPMDMIPLVMSYMAGGCLTRNSRSNNHRYCLACNLPEMRRCIGRTLCDTRGCLEVILRRDTTVCDRCTPADYDSGDEWY